MVKLIKEGVYLKNGRELVPAAEGMPSPCEAKKKTIAYSILSAHNSGDDKNLKLKFDALASHDITYVGILLTARAGGLERLPVPYVLTTATTAFVQSAAPSMRMTICSDCPPQRSTAESTCLPTWQSSTLSCVR